MQICVARRCDISIAEVARHVTPSFYPFVFLNRDSVETQRAKLETSMSILRIAILTWAG